MIHLTHLADVFAAGGFDQLINRVVGILSVRSDLCIGEEDRLLGRILYMGNISRGIVGVG